MGLILLGGLVGMERAALWQLGHLRRVYYVPTAERADGEPEPDAFHRGIAPSAKLLHAVVSRLVEIDLSSAIELVRRWKSHQLPGSPAALGCPITGLSGDTRRRSRRLAAIVG